MQVTLSITVGGRTTTGQLTFAVNTPHIPSHATSSAANALACLQVNRAPSGGSLLVSPLQGVSLRTPFALSAPGFSDPDLQASNLALVCLEN